MKRHQQETKHVKFSPDVVETERTFLPYQKSKRQPNYSRMQKEALVLFTNQDNEKFAEYFSSFAQEEKENFFRREGRIFFSWAFIEARDAKPLEVLKNIVPYNVFVEILSNKDFAILSNFLRTHKRMEQYAFYDQKQKNIAVEKIAVVLKIGNEEINEFIKNNISDTLKNNFDPSTSFQMKI